MFFSCIFSNVTKSLKILFLKCQFTLPKVPAALALPTAIFPTHPRGNSTVIVNFVSIHFFDRNTPSPYKPKTQIKGVLCVNALTHNKLYGGKYFSFKVTNKFVSIHFVDRIIPSPYNAENA